MGPIMKPEFKNITAGGFRPENHQCFCWVVSSLRKNKNAGHGWFIIPSWAWTENKGLVMFDTFRKLIQTTRGLGVWLSQSLTFGSLAAACGPCFLRLQKAALGSTSGRRKGALQDHGIWRWQSLTFGSLVNVRYHSPAGPLGDPGGQEVVALNKLQCIQWLRRKIQAREKVGKSRNTVFFQWFVAPEGRKVGSLKPRVQSQLARWEMKNCTPLWREAHFQVNMYKTHQRRTTFRSCDVEKSAQHCGTKHISKSKCAKHVSLGPLLEVAMSKKCTPLWREANFEVKMLKPHMFGPLLAVQMPFRVAGVRVYAPCQQWAKRKGFVAFPKTMASVGHLKRIWKDAFSVACAVQETCSSELLGGPGAVFLRGVAFWSIKSLVLGRWFCVTGAALRTTWHHFFVAGAVL